MVPEAQALLDRIGQLSAESRFSIGCLLPLSGPSAIFGEQALDGAEFALHRHHSAMEASAIEVLVKDTASDPQKAVDAVRELAGKDVAAIIGPIFTAKEAAAEAQRLGIPIITITQKDDIALIGDFVFRNFFTPRMQIQALVAYAVTELNLSRFAILYPDDKYGQTFMNLLWDEVIAAGARVVGVESYEGTQTDFADPIKKLAGIYGSPPPKSDAGDGSRQLPVLDFEALFIPDSPRRAGLVIPQLAYNDVVDIQLLGTNLWHSEQLLKMARPYVQGAIMPDIFFADSQNPLVRSFRADFAKAYEREPGFIEAVLYDTAMMVFQVLDAAGVGFRPAIRDRISGLRDYAGVTGLTSFSESGEVQKSLYLLRIEKSKFVEIPR
jgi:ABC-type branched-subunit amino acid transport system substrate-binding protein